MIVEKQQNYMKNLKKEAPAPVMTLSATS